MPGGVLGWLDQLAALKGRFGRDEARSTATILEKLKTARLRDPEQVIRLHETVLFLRAYPQSPRVLRIADQILFSFQDRVRGLDPAEFEYADVSGIAGTGLSTNFSYDIARSLATRYPRSIRINWEKYAHMDRLGPVLARLLPLAAEDWSVESHVDWQRWVEARRGSKNDGDTILWLLKQLQPEIYDLLEIPLRWELGQSGAARSRTRIPRREIFYHTGPFLKRSGVSIRAEFASPKIPAERVSRKRAQKVLDLIADTSAVRYRELYGFSHPDAAHVYHADLGRGIDFYFFGVPRQSRLPLRAYHSGMYFKNGVPIGYVEVMSLFERMEVGFNLYYTFREGETAWLYARLLKLFHEQLGVTCFSIDPYQIGQDNDEAIESGAFWFYRKLGFRSGSKETEALAEREEAKIARKPGYRTPPSILRRLAEAPLIYSDAPGRGREWDRFEIRNVGYHMARTGEELDGTMDLLEAKNGPEEKRYLRLLQTDPEFATLRRQVLTWGSRKH